MGCGASTPQPMDAAQNEELFQAAAKTMVHLCTQSAFDTVIKEKSKVAAPAEGTKFIRDTIAELRSTAAGAGDATKGKGDEIAAKAGGLAGGAIGGMLGKVADVAGKAADAGANAVLTPIADALQKQLDALDDAFSDVASELVTAKKTELGGVYEQVLNNCKFANVQQTVRGSDNKACSSKFMEACGDLLKAQLLPPSQDFIDKSKPVKAWDKCIEKVIEGSKVVQRLMNKDESELKDPIKLDINKYIVDEVIKQITVAMEAQEVSVRAAPKDKSKDFANFCNAFTFEVAFSQEPLLVTHWKAFKG